MKDLYIVGAGGCGREVLRIIKDIHRIQGARWNIKGFLDDTEDPLAGKECDYTVVGTIRDFRPGENDVLALGIASPAAKKKLVPMLLERGAVFETIIEPTSEVPQFSSVGVGCVLYDHVAMSVNVRVGDYVTLLPCTLGHDVCIGDYTTVSAMCHFGGGVQVGEGVFLGTNSIVRPHMVIEDGANVGLGSVVIRRVKAGVHVFGNPAREI